MVSGFVQQLQGAAIQPRRCVVLRRARVAQKLVQLCGRGFVDLPVRVVQFELARFTRGLVLDAQRAQLFEAGGSPVCRLRAEQRGAFAQARCRGGGRRLRRRCLTWLEREGQARGPE
jgi:hypothetical protein